jgi:hypothetical protein
MVTSLPSLGQIARVRQRLYLVEGIVKAPTANDSNLVRLSCVDDDAQGQPLEVLWEKELDAEPLDAEAWDAIAKRGFDEPSLFSAYLHTLRWNCVTATDPRLFQSPFRAGIKLDAYQLEPLRKALLLPRVNLFIADDVGLGKTIEAGLIARELLLRKKVREVVVSCPPSMLLQWKEELESRFGLMFEILDKEYMKRVRRERGFGVNPWTTHSRFLISHRLLIDEAYTGPMLDWLRDFRPGTLLILDEAHHAAPSSGQRYAIDSQTTRAVQERPRLTCRRMGYLNNRTVRTGLKLEGQRPHLAGEYRGVGQFGSAGKLQFAVAQLVQFQSPRIAIDDEHFARLDFGVKGKLVPGEVAGTDDLDEEVRPAEPVRAVIDRRVIGKIQNDIRAAEVFHPVRMTIRDVDSGANLPCSLDFK